MYQRITVSNKASSATVKATAGALHGYIIYDGGSGDCTAEFKDGGSGGTSMWKDRTVTADAPQTMLFQEPIPFNTDIYCTIGGTSPTVYILYK